MKRSYSITVRITPAEYALIEALAAQQQRSISGVVRQIISSAGPPQKNSVAVLGQPQKPSCAVEKRERGQ